MRIVSFVPDAFGGHGGIALYGRNVLSALCEHPNAAEVVAVPRVAPNPLEALPTNLIYLSEAKGSKLKFCATAFQQLLKRKKFDLVVCGHIHLLPIAHLARQVTGAPIILFVYGIDAWQPTKSWLTNSMIRHVDAIVSIRERTLERLRHWADLDRVPTYVLENAIDLGKYGLLPRNQALVDKYGLQQKRVLMTMGRVEEPYKGFDEVIDVLPVLLAEMPGIMYVVAGGGHDLPRIKQKAAEAGVAGQVVFTDIIAEAEKSDYYRLADVFAMPGSAPDFDRYPLRFVFLEAMACGLPVVASRPDGSRDLLGTEGLPLHLVDPSDRNSILSAIRAALNHGPIDVSAALSRYAFPAFAKRLQQIVDEVLGRRRNNS